MMNIVLREELNQETQKKYIINSTNLNEEENRTVKVCKNFVCNFLAPNSFKAVDRLKFQFLKLVLEALNFPLLDYISKFRKK